MLTPILCCARLFSFRNKAFDYGYTSADKRCLKIALMRRTASYQPIASLHTTDRKFAAHFIPSERQRFRLRYHFVDSTRPSKFRDRVVSTNYDSFLFTSPAILLRFVLLGYQDCLAPIFAKWKINNNDSSSAVMKKFTFSFTRSLLSTNPNVDKILSDILARDMSYALDVHQLRHVLSTLSITQKDSMALASAENDLKLYQIIKQVDINTQNLKLYKCGKIVFLKHQKKNWYMTSYCNDLALNMLSRKIKPGPMLCGKNLKTAANRFQLSVVQMYLDNINSSEKSLTPDVRRALSAFARNMHLCRKNNLNFPISEIERKECYKKSLKLLTGWEKDGMPVPGEVRKVSFATIPHELDVEREIWLRSYYPTYICVLADLGFAETLDNEWEILSNTSRTKYMASLFASAFLLVKKPRRALSLLEDFNAWSESLNTNAKQLQAQENSSSPEIAHILLAMYTYFRMKTTLNLRKYLRQLEYNDTPIYLLYNLVQYIPPNHNMTSSGENVSVELKNDRLIEWTKDVYGEMGLLISNNGGKTPTYWRPGSLSKRQLSKYLLQDKTWTRPSVQT
ncbi:BgtAc-31157 [Blumeria graminis f. sp. tritici]|uniref:BgtAc-31157 n=2 Tax=Blumeria graminis f. sp. tritici TaxID=62690 RepID=A0A9X9MQR8_BLUGR|nr:hypothetical protein BGT96224_Ac31157 [Blumeria graminis f. sp. tritici 96224]VDB96350.1 BgtAc-31157 [Blumeria graminis f. sp. tritici]